MMSKRIFTYATMFSDREQLKNIPTREYSQADKRRILDYLYNEDFSVYDDMFPNEEIDVFDNKPLLVYSGVSAAGDYTWTSLEPLYVLKHNLALEDGILEQIDGFYEEGNKVSETTWDWEEYLSCL